MIPSYFISIIRLPSWVHRNSRPRFALKVVETPPTPFQRQRRRPPIVVCTKKIACTLTARKRRLYDTSSPLRHITQPLTSIAASPRRGPAHSSRIYVNSETLSFPRCKSVLGYATATFERPHNYRGITTGHSLSFVLRIVAFAFSEG